MRSSGSQTVYSIDYVIDMIDFIEQKIQTNTLTPAISIELQRRLDVLSAAYANDPHFAEYYPHMLELQTLIYGESGQEKKALVYLKEAVREAGGVRGLYSRLLQQYIADHTRQAPTPARAERRAPVAEKQFKEPKQHKFLTFRKLAVGFAAIFILAATAGLTLHFVPHASALPVLIVKHSEISRQRQAYDNLEEQYKTCSADLAQQKSSLNPDDIVAVDTFNKDTKSCANVLKQLNHVAEQYNNLIGIKNAL